VISTTAALGFHVTGCADDNPEITTTVDPEALVVGPGASACNAAPSGTQTSVAFATMLGCGSDGGGEKCALDPLTLRAATRSDAASGESTTRWTITRGKTVLLAKTTRTTPTATSFDIEFDADFQGVHSATINNDGTTVTGTVDGRALAPSTVGKPAGQGGFQFADHGSAPSVQIDSATQTAIFALLDKAAADSPAACANVRGGSAMTGMSGALGNMKTTFGYGPTGPAHSPSAKTKAVPSFQEDLVSFQAPQGAPLDFDGAHAQNNLADIVSPDCQSCQRSCINNIFCELAPPCEVACYGECFIPGVQPGCAENVCPVAGIGGCDSNETCCGAGCCGPGTTCGNSSLGACCPSDLPVGCGNETKVTCFAAGSTCCGNLSQACPPGDVCTNVSATDATCCPAANAAPDGECCQGAACGNGCCDNGGTCANGTCCFGPIDTNGNCCSWLATICNGQCCAGSCTASGTCCPNGGTVCGSACCGQGQSCTDPANSICSAISQATLELTDPNLGTVVAQSGGTQVSVPNSASFNASGQAFVAGGVVTLSVDSPSGTVIGTATADGSGNFTVRISMGRFPAGSHTLVAWESVNGSTIQTSVSLFVESVG
jgi:hypothetical protein